MIKHVKLFIDAIRFNNVRLSQEAKDFLDDHMLDPKDWDVLRERYGVSDVKKIPDCIRFDFLNKLIADFNSLNTVKESVIPFDEKHVHHGVSVEVGMDIRWDHPDVLEKPATYSREESIEKANNVNKSLSLISDDLIAQLKNPNQQIKVSRIDFPFTHADLIQLREMEIRTMIVDTLFKK